MKQHFLVFCFHTRSATTVNHSCNFTVVITAQVFSGSQSDNFNFLGTLPLNINSLRRHLLSVYWSLGSAGEIKKRKTKRSLPGFKKSLEGKIFANRKLKNCEQEL